MNYLFGNILIPIRTFFKDNISWIGGEHEYSNMKYTGSEIYLKLILNFGGVKGFDENIFIFYNDKIEDKTYFVYIFGYPYVWNYTPSTNEKDMSSYDIRKYMLNKFKAIYEQSKKFKKKNIKN